MALLNLNDLSVVPDYPGRDSVARRASIFHHDTDVLAPLFSDEELTVSLGQPLRAGAGGSFARAFLMAGDYDVKILDHRGVPLTEVTGIRLPENSAVGFAWTYPDSRSLMSSSVLTYADTPGARTVSEGDYLRAVEEQATFQVLASDAGAAHLVTDSGVKLRVVGPVWPAAAFGVIADSDVTGATGTDSGAALFALATALSAHDGDARLVFPAGVVRSSQTLNIEGTSLASLHLDGQATRIVFTHATPEANRPYISVVREDRGGGSCTITGLTADLARNPLRTAGSDMISVAGFDRVEVRGCTIPSADNIAIAVDRNHVTVPSLVRICDNHIGGKPPVTGAQHQYGAIGDTGIWVLNAGELTVITGNRVSGTGDDAIAIAETQVAGTASRALIAQNDVRNCQGAAYKSSATHTVFSGNAAELTGNDMYRVIALNHSGGDCVPESFQILGGQGRRIGQADAISLGVTTMLPTPHTCAIHLENAGGGGMIRDLSLTDTAGAVIKVTSDTRACDGIDMQGCHIEGAQAILQREGGAAPGPLTNVTIARNEIVGGGPILLAWEAKQTALPEGDVLWQGNRLTGCDFSSVVSLFQFVGSGTGFLQNIRIEGDLWHDVTGPIVSLLELGGADPSVVTHWFFDEGALTALPVGGGRVRNNQDAGCLGLGPEQRVRRGARKTVVTTREFNSDNVLLTLDPAKAWEVEAKALRNANASHDDVYYRATWDVVRSRVAHETSMGGGPDGNCAVELVQVTPTNPSDQVFSGSTVLQLQGTAAGWTDGGGASDPLIYFEVTWREVLDHGHSVKID